MEKVEFFYDFSCPYAYLASTQIEAVCAHHGAELVLKPMLLGGVFRHWSRPQNMSAGMSPAKARHNLLDMQRWARHWSVELTMPEAHPMRTVTALRLVLAAPPEARWRLSQAIFAAYWVEGRDVSARETLGALLREQGLPGALLERAEAPEIKQALWERTQEAIDRGVFGAPTIFLGDDRYWGQDRLHLVERRLATSSGSPLLSVHREAGRLEDRTIRFFFDFSSPFAYLASTQVERFARDEGATLRWHPMLLGAVFKAVGTANVPLFEMIPPKQAHGRLDMARFAALYDAPLSFPTRFPMRTVTALRMVLALQETAPDAAVALTHRLFRAYWAEDQDIDDPGTLTTLAEQVGVDGAGLLERTRAPEVKQALFDRTREAVEAGVFGAPSFQVDDGPVFWGQDRLELLYVTL